MVRARMQTHLGQTYVSWAEFVADAAGVVEVAKQAPVRGTYERPDAMGLIESMTLLAKGERTGDGPLDPVFVELTAEVCGEVVAQHLWKRLFVQEDVEQQQVREPGLVGTLFYPDGEGECPSVIVLGGSEGGLTVRRAALLASHGYAALALAYFGREGLPQQLVEVPLETVERAIVWLKEQPMVRKGALCLMGTSKGGELALAAASQFADVTAVVAYVPSGVVFPGIGSFEPGKRRSSWSYRGEALAFAQAEPTEDVLAEIARCKEAGEPVSYRAWYLSFLREAVGTEQATIPVEKINGSVLLISGGDDQLWPSDVLAEQVKERLMRVSHPHEVVHLKYDRAGHAIGHPYFPTAETVVSPMGGGVTMTSGGSAEANAEAGADSWPRVLAFLERSLQRKGGR